MRSFPSSCDNSFVTIISSMLMVKSSIVSLIWLRTKDFQGVIDEQHFPWKRRFRCKRSAWPHLLRDGIYSNHTRMLESAFKQEGHALRLHRNLAFHGSYRFFRPHLGSFEAVTHWNIPSNCMESSIGELSRITMEPQNYWITPSWWHLVGGLGEISVKIAKSDTMLPDEALVSRWNLHNTHVCHSISLSMTWPTIE